MGKKKSRSPSGSSRSSSSRSRSRDNYKRSRDHRRRDHSRDRGSRRREDRHQRKKEDRERSRHRDERRDERKKDSRYERSSRDGRGNRNEKKRHSPKNYRDNYNNKNPYNKSDNTKKIESKIHLDKNYVENELEKWKKINSELAPSQTVSFGTPNTIMKEQIEAKQIPELAVEELEIIDKAKLEEERIQEARRRRQELLERLGATTQPSLNSINSETKDLIQTSTNLATQLDSQQNSSRIEIEPNSKEEIYSAGDKSLEQNEEELEAGAEFEVHDETGHIVQPLHFPSSHHASHQVANTNLQVPQGQQSSSSSGSSSSYDMFAGDSEDEDKKNGRNKKEKRSKRDGLVETTTVGKVRNRETDYDDEEQYYIAHNGEILHDTFKVLSTMGKGVYGSVLKAQEISTGRIVAIKVG